MAEQTSGVPLHQSDAGRAEAQNRVRNLTATELEQHSWARVQHSPLFSMWDLHGVPLKVVMKGTWEGINDDNLFGRASQLAYAFFSALFPALIAMSSLMGLFAKSSSEIYYALLTRIGRLIPPSAFTLVMETFKQTTSASTTGKVTLGVLVALFSASVGISAIQDTLNTVYKVKETRAFWKARLEAIVLTVVVAVTVVTALSVLFAGDYAAGKASHWLNLGHLPSIIIRIVTWAAASLLMTVSFEVMYYACPDLQNRKWRWITPGGVIGLMGWIVGSIGLRIYLHFFNSYSATYGSLGAVVILLLWFYLTGVMILLGGELNSEIEHAVAQSQIVSGNSPLAPQSSIDKVEL